MGGEALQIAAVHRAMAAMAHLTNIMSRRPLLKAYPDGWRVAGIRVTA
jgi:hypothetical protein